MNKRYNSKMNNGTVNEFLLSLQSSPNRLDKARGLLTKLYSQSDNGSLNYYDLRRYLLAFDHAELSQKSLSIYASITLDYLLWLDDSQLIAWFYEIVNECNWQFVLSKRYRDNRP
jgi:hypothetical protein